MMVQRNGILSLLLRPSTIAGLLIVLAVAAFAVWFVLVRDNRTPLEVEYADRNARELGDSETASRLFSISLIPGSQSETNAAARYPAAQLTDPVLFRLALMRAETEGAELSVSVEGPNGTTFSLPNARVFRTPYGAELRFLIPKRTLTAGEHKVKIGPPRGGYGGTVYRFRID